MLLLLSIVNAHITCFSVAHKSRQTATHSLNIPFQPLSAYFMSGDMTSSLETSKYSRYTRRAKQNGFLAGLLKTFNEPLSKI